MNKSTNQQPPRGNDAPRGTDPASDCEHGSLTEFLNKVTHGDTLELLRRLPDQSIDFIHTTLEHRFGTSAEYKEWLSVVFAEFHRVLKPGRSCLNYVNWLYPFGPVPIWLDCGFSVLSRHQKVTPPTDRTSRWGGLSEQYLITKGPFRDFTLPQGCCQPDEPDSEFQTQDRSAALVDIIRELSGPNEIVLDPFANRGEVGLAARSCGRQFILSESDPTRYQSAAHALDLKTQPGS
jgi:DNA modification methylase